MNLNPILNRFLQLVAYDQSLRSTEQQLFTVIDEIIDLEQTQQDSLQGVEKAKEVVRTLRKQVDVKEREMEELEGKVTAIKSKMEAVATSREYEIVRKELEHVHELRNAGEDELLTAWNALENAQKLVAKEERNAHEQAAALRQRLAEKGEEKLQLEATLIEKDQERRSHETDIPAAWLEDYARIKRSFVNPVVLVENGACSACYESLSGHQLNDLARKQLYPCPGCFRFLYNKP